MQARGITRVAAPLRVEVTEAIRQDIVTSEFKPGDRLIESVLCDKFQVSRTVIREALRQLETEGLVTMVPNRGPVVATLTLQDAENLYEVRCSLESLAGRLFAERASEAERRDLKSSLKEVKKTMSGSDAVARLRAKDDFYTVLIAGSKNLEIGRMLKTVNARTQMLRMYSLSSADRSTQTVREITRITDAAVRGDPEETHRACEDHVRNATEAALREMRHQQALVEA